MSELKKEKEIKEAIKTIKKWRKNRNLHHCSGYSSSTAIDALEWALGLREHFEYAHGVVY